MSLSSTDNGLLTPNNCAVLFKGPGRAGWFDLVRGASDSACALQ